MLPLVVKEESIFIFKFWFEGSICYGMHYQNELYCRLNTFAIQNRLHVYQLACRLMRDDVTTALSITADTCSLWGSLRSPLIKDILENPASLQLPTSDM